jgi:hypothetical protein
MRKEIKEKSKPASDLDARAKPDHKPGWSPELVDRMDERPMLKSAAKPSDSSRSFVRKIPEKPAASKAAPPAYAPGEPLPGDLKANVPMKFDKSAGYSDSAPAATPTAPLPKLMGGRKSPASGPSVLVVYCNITPEAVKKKTLDKLLVSNGISRDLQLGAVEPVKSGKLGGEAKKAETARPSVVNNESNVRANFALNRLLEENNVTAAGADVVCVEATSAQIEATLAELATLPDLFVSVSVKPSENPTASQLAVRFEQLRNQNIEGRSQAGEGEKRADQFADTAKSPRGVGMGMAPASQPPAPLEPTHPQQSAPTSQSPVARRLSSQQQLQAGMAQSAVASSPRQRVLFVLNVVDASAPAEKRVSPAKNSSKK